MKKTRKKQLIILGILLVLLIGVFALLKSEQSPLKEEEEEAADDYQVLNIDEARVLQIGIIGGDETVNLEKEGEAWQCVDQPETAIDSTAVELFLSEVCTVTSDTRIENVQDLSEYGLGDPTINVTLQWDSNMYTLKVGDYNSMIASYYVTLNDENTVYTIDSTLYYQLNKTLEDFELVETEETEETAETEEIE